MDKEPAGLTASPPNRFPTTQGVPMDAAQIAQIQEQALNNELANLYSQKVLMEMKVADAATPTGDPKVDADLEKAAINAKSMIVGQTRMIASREARLAEIASKA